MILLRIPLPNIQICWGNHDFVGLTIDCGRVFSIMFLHSAESGSVLHSLSVGCGVSLVCWTLDPTGS
jgi:hypothetical protein